MSPPPPPPGCVQLNLYTEEDLCLNIPIAIITNCCRRPFAYLRYIGWCVLGSLGELKDNEGNAVSLDEKHIHDQTIYEYHTDSGLQHAIDPEVIQLMSSVPTIDTEFRVPFRQLLLHRDGFCAWTGMSVNDGMHIIPFARGDEWFKLLLENRPHEGEDIEDIDINDFRNGVIVSPIVYGLFEERKVAVLTPNPILTCDDIPPRQVREQLQPGVSYPADCRYTLQWITDIDDLTRGQVSEDNNDAMFLDHDFPKPLKMLFHYSYGAAMIQRYGVNKEVLCTRAGVPRPTKDPVVDRSRLINNLEQLGDNQTQGLVEMEKSLKQKSLDAEEIVLRFWANTKVARERRAKEEAERRERMEDWRSKIIP